MRLWLVRHGVTEWSESGRLCGWADIPLNSVGRDQAISLRGRWSQARLAGVWTSDLIRAAEFAELAHGEATPDRRLRELDFGDLEGLTWGECDQPTRLALTRFEGFAAPGGETLAQLEDRIGDFLCTLTQGDHLIFTHGGVIRLLSGIGGATLSPAPGELTVVEWPSREQNGQQTVRHP